MINSRLFLTLSPGGPLFRLGAISACLWGFSVLASAVVAGHTLAFDEWLLRSLRPEASTRPELTRVALSITDLGSAPVLILLIVAVVGYLALLKAYRSASLLLFSTAGGMVLSTLLKQFYGRPRPEVISHLQEVVSASFPSGHTLHSTVVYFMLAALLIRALSRRRLKLYVLTSAALLVGLIGCSRVYLGVHYPTDVLAGWSVGIFWVLLCWNVGCRHLDHVPASSCAEPYARAAEDPRAENVR